MGRPLLFYKSCEKNLSDDYDILIESIKEMIPSRETTIFMDHGSAHYSNASYSCLQLVLRDKGFDNDYIANVEGYSHLIDVLAIINRKSKNNKYTEVNKKVTLIPLIQIIPKGQ